MQIVHEVAFLQVSRLTDEWMRGLLELLDRSP